MDELNEDFEKLMELYQSIKRQVRQRDKHLYERWKAGGFCIDNDIVSMYPSLPEVMESLQEEVCDECGEPLKTFMKDGTNLQEVYGCADCDS